MAKIFGPIKNMVFDKKDPVSLIQFVTNRCNARCSFCFIDFDDVETQKKSHELTVDQYDQLSRNLGKNLMHVNLTGGEPFLRTDLPDIAKCFFKNSGIDSVLITTNGSLPDKIGAYIETVLSEYPKKQLYFGFSIDALGDEHNRIRKIKGLFDKAMESYQTVRRFAPRTSAAVNLTVTHENYNSVCNLYKVLKEGYGIQTFNAIIARDEGVYKIPPEVKNGILIAYKKLSQMIIDDVATGNTEGFETSNVQGWVLNAKNQIQYKEIARTYETNAYKSLCPAGSIFGVIHADGTVYPCEVLHKPLGNLKDYAFDFLKLWKDRTAVETKDWIKQSQCRCTWECAWTYNILSNPTYYPELVQNMIKKAA